jgi:hypothetical protein
MGSIRLAGEEWLDSEESAGLGFVKKFAATSFQCIHLVGGAPPRLTELSTMGGVLYPHALLRRIALRPQLLVLLIPLLLTGCGTTEHKTVIITPPANSTTTVDSNGTTHTTTNN